MVNKFAIIIHLYYVDLWSEFYEKIKILNNFDLYVTLPYSNSAFKKKILRDFPNAIIYDVENRGRDILPFLKIIRKYDFSNYFAIVKLHTKKSLHYKQGHVWRKDLLNNLIGSNEKVINILKYFDDDNVAMIGLNKYWNTNFLKNKYLYGNKAIYYQLCRHYEVTDTALGFFAGSMFWLNYSVIQELNNYNIPEYLFKKETGKIDGEAHHSFERLFGSISLKTKLKIIHI